MDWDEYCEDKASTSDWIIPVAIVSILLGVIILIVIL